MRNAFKKFKLFITHELLVTMETGKRLERGLNYNYNSYFRRFHFRKWLTVLRSVSNSRKCLFCRCCESAIPPIFRTFKTEQVLQWQL